jgi:hypothetical protein
LVRVTRRMVSLIVIIIIAKNTPQVARDASWENVTLIVSLPQEKMLP